MSTNCLVTKLKGVVNNNNLKRLGEMTFKAYGKSNGDQGELRIALTEAVYYEIDGVLQSVKENVIVVHPSSPSTPIEVTILDKYKIREISNNRYVGGVSGDVEFDLADLKYCESLTTIILTDATKVYGDISNLENKPSLITFEANMCENITGNISSYLNMPNVTKVATEKAALEGDLSVISRKNFTAFLCRGTKLTGSINVFNTNQNITRLTLDTSSPEVTGNIETLPLQLNNIAAPESQVAGSVEAFAVARHTAGKTTGNDTLKVKNSLCTFNQAIINETTLFITYEENLITVSWSSNPSNWMGKYTPNTGTWTYNS